MQIKIFFIPLALLFTLLACQTGTSENPQQVQANPLDKNFSKFMQWFEGEYDNHEQVWQQEQDDVPEKERHEHIHHIFQPVKAPTIGEHTFFVKQYMDGDYEKVYRQRLYSFSKNSAEDVVQLTIYNFNDEKKYRYTDQNPDAIQAITAEELRTVPGCEVYWKFNGEYFDGYMKDKACHFFSKRSQKELYITDSLRLTPDEIWIGDKAFDQQGNKVFGRDEQHKNRKVRYFKGWAAIKRNKLDTSAGEDEWLSMKNMRIHNEGQQVSITDADGKKSGYALQLERLTYQNTRQPILKLGLVEEATGKTITYVWSEVGSTRVGMNLRWMQAGLTLEEDSRKSGDSKTG